MQKSCLLVTITSYPHGGGESFFHQSAAWLVEEGYEVSWISFRERQWYRQETVSNENFYTDIRTTRKRLRHWIDKICPSVIHAMPERDADVTVALDECGKKVVIGHHFWSGLIVSDIHPFSIGMKSNPTLRLDPVLLALLDNPLICHYVVSEFMNEILQKCGGQRMTVISPLSDHHRCELPPLLERDSIAVINDDPLKGREILASLTRKTSLPFLIVGTGTYPTNVRVVSSCDVKDIYKSARIVLIPSLVDETFCRVAYEAADLGIAIVTTGNGYIREMLGDAGIYEEGDWVTTIEWLYYDLDRLRDLSEKLRAAANRLGSSREQFVSLFR
jgi:hypothetical protein